MNKSTVRLKSDMPDTRGNFLTIACDPTERHFAVLFDEGTLILCDRQTGEETQRLLDSGGLLERFAKLERGEDRGSSPTTIAFSFDGKWLASGADSVITIWEVDTGKEVLRLPGHDAAISALAFGPDGRTVMSLAEDGRGYRWALKPNRSSRLGTLAEAWETLDRGAPAAAYSAQWRMIADPNESVSFLRDRLKPIPSLDGDTIQKWIVDLNSDSFRVRDAASKELRKAGDLVLAPIQRELANDVSLEVRRRLNQVVEFVKATPDPEALRKGRAIMVLERIGSPEAQEILATLARGAPGARATDEAASALRRLRNSLGSFVNPSPMTPAVP